MIVQMQYLFRYFQTQFIYCYSILFSKVTLACSSTFEMLELIKVLSLFVHCKSAVVCLLKAAHTFHSIPYWLNFLVFLPFFFLLDVSGSGGFALILNYSQ